MTDRRILAAVALVLIAAGATGAVGAQESPTTTPTPNMTDTPQPTPNATAAPTATPTATPTPEPTATPTATSEPTATPMPESATDENTTYLIEINEHTRIVSADWNDGEVTMTIESDRSQFVVITDASVDITGAVNIPRDQVRVPPGYTEITFETTNPSEAAVTVAAGESLVGLGSDERATFFPATPMWQDVWFAGIGGGAAGLGAVLILGWIRVSTRDDEHERVV